MTYKNKVEIQLSNISAEDHIIIEAFWGGSDLVFHYKTLNIFDFHTSSSEQHICYTKNSLLVFHDVKILESFYYDFSKAIESGKNVFRIPEDAEIVDTSPMERCSNVKSYELIEELEDGRRVAVFELENDTVFRISYSKVFILFNEIEEY